MNTDILVGPQQFDAPALWRVCWVTYINGKRRSGSSKPMTYIDASFEVSWKSAFYPCFKFWAIPA